MNSLIKNWKSASVGLAMILTALINLAYKWTHGGLDQPTIELSVGAIMGGLGIAVNSVNHAALSAKVDTTALAVTSGDRSMLPTKAVAATPVVVQPPAPAAVWPTSPAPAPAPVVPPVVVVPPKA